MLIVFFDAEVLIHWEFVPEGHAELYVGVLDWLLKRIRRVRTAKYQSNKWYLLHDNAPSHNAAIVKKFLANRKVAAHHHPPYSPDLAPADYFLFPKLKFSLKGRHFQTVEKFNVQWQGSLTTFQKLLSWRAWRSWRNVQTNVLIKEKCILKNKNKSCPYKKLSLFYNSCLKTFGSHLVHLYTFHRPLDKSQCTREGRKWYRGKRQLLVLIFTRKHIT